MVLIESVLNADRATESRSVEQRRVKERPLVKSLAAERSADAALGVLSHFRVEFYDCLYTRADTLFELTDVVLCSDGPVTSLVELTLTAEHRRGHGAMYDAVNHGWLEPRRLRRLLASSRCRVPPTGGSCSRWT